MSLTFIFFIILSIIAIASGIVTISHKNPVTSAMSLVVHFFMLAGLYLTLQAQFVAIVQILVYAGAIMVLVIFVIMLLNLGDETKHKEKFGLRTGAAILFSIALVLQFMIVLFGRAGTKTEMSANAPVQGTVQAIGTALFSNYLFPFEAISLLLLTAIVGAVVLAKRKLE